jgi:mRNA-degrading endonuclease HigB of HigAB toxin-antitoxin module
VRSTCIPKRHHEGTFRQTPSAPTAGDNRVIFDLGGNKYRLIVHVSLRSAACS